MQQGKVWFWDLAVVAQVKTKNSEAVETKLGQTLWAMMNP